MITNEQFQNMKRMAGFPDEPQRPIEFVHRGLPIQFPTGSREGCETTAGCLQVLIADIMEVNGPFIEWTIFLHDLAVAIEAAESSDAS